MGLFQWLFGAKDPPLAENANDPGLVSELVQAAQAGDEKRVQTLLKRGVNPNNRNNDGESALIEAVSKEHPRVVKLLLQSGADPNFKSAKGWPVLMYAAWEGVDGTPMMKRLLACTPGAAPAPSHWREILLILLASGADPNGQVETEGNLKGCTALIRALQEGSAAVVKELLKAGANPDLCIANGASALHLAAQDGNAEIVSLLLDAGANPNIQRNDGWTSLMAAALKGNSLVVQTLLRKKADVRLRNDGEKTAMQIALDAGHDEIALQLLAAGSPS